jgi:hypothetical protein
MIPPYERISFPQFIINNGRILLFKYITIINLKYISYYIYITISLILILTITDSLLLLGLDGMDIVSMSLNKGERK